MNCEECQDLLSDFLDGALTPEANSVLDDHLRECSSCQSARDELESIVSFCLDHRGEDEAPPNERAMWLRIQNVIESEVGSPPVPQISEVTSSRRLAILLRLNRSWRLSLPQLVTAIATVAVGAALVTAFGVRSMLSSNSHQSLAIADGVASNGDTMDVRTREKQLNAEYWTKRVEERRGRWTPQMREAFDRNLSVYEQAVEDSRTQLSRNPQDEVSEEMLHSALDDKIELLKEFSEQ
jgi:hypothetical protein